MFPAPELRALATGRRSISYVLGHGFTGSADHPKLNEIARDLNSLGATVMLLSFRGHGQSGGQSTVGADEHLDIAAGVRWLREHRPDDAVVTIGFSMGAAVVVRHGGLSAGSAQPQAQPDALVAVSGPGRWYERGSKPMRLAHFGVETRLGRLILRRGFATRIDPRGWPSLPPAPVEVARDIKAPLLVVHGDNDHYFGLEHPRMLASSVAHSDLWIEPGMGHAENATTRELLARIDDWARSATMTQWATA
jgi:alpha/beta superfamily hydrolase